MVRAKGSWFTRFAMHASHGAGRPAAFVIAAVVILAWALTGPIYGFSDRWMWVIHTATSIATFLLVFLLHNSESRNTEAIQIKLDELIRVMDDTRKGVLDLEKLDQRQLDEIHERYERLGRWAKDKE
jgi:low affinity Fe/Cu permease